MTNHAKQDILQAFNTLIRKHSMDRITVEQLVQEAGVSKATFYRHFRDKYDVMNYNYKILLDELASPEKSSCYEMLCQLPTT